MTKNPEFQKELLKNVTEGVKPSDLKKKLKRSKSADDIATSSTPNTPLKKSQSQLEITLTQQPSPQEKITNLKEQVKFHAETAANYLTSLQTSQAKVSELEEKLKEKTTELDNSLLARYEAVKQFGKIYDKLQGIRKELDENVDQASDEIISADDKVSSLRTKLFTARQQINSLQRDLNLAQKLAEMRKYPLPNKESNWDYLKYPLYSLVLVLFTFWLTNHLRNQ